MSVTNEVSELHIKVAELENDLWHMTKERDNAVASTQTLIQVVNNLTTTNQHPKPTPHSSQAENDASKEGEIQELSKKLKDSQDTIKKLQEQLAASERYRKNLHDITRKLADKATISRDFSEDEGTLADDESHHSSLASRRQTKRTRRFSTNGESSSRPSNIPAVVPQLPTASERVDTSKSIYTAAPVVDKPAHLSSAITEEKAAKKAEDARVMKLKLEKLQQLKLAQSVKSPLADKFSKISLSSRAPSTLKGTPEATTSKAEEPCLGFIMKGHAFTDLVVSQAPNLPAESITLQGKRKREEPLELEEDYASQDLDYDGYAYGGDDGEYDYGCDGEYSDDGYVYHNEEEIDLDLSDSSDGSPNRDTTIITIPSEPPTPLAMALNQRLPPPPNFPTEWDKLSPAVKALDYIRGGWETTDEDEPASSSKPKKVKIPEELEAEAEIDEQNLPTFYEPLPATILNTGSRHRRDAEPQFVYKAEEDCNYAYNNPYGSLLEVTYDQAHSLDAPCNKDMWECTEERQMALEAHLDEDRYIPSFFKYGLTYAPGRAEHGILRTVLISNLPDETTIGDLTARVRCGMIISASIMDTKKLLGYKTAMVVFERADEADMYSSAAEEAPISFGDRITHTQLLQTPTYPMRTGLVTNINRYDNTRYIQIPHYPKHSISTKTLIYDLTTKESRHSAMPDAYRADNMEEPYYDRNFGVMHLAFGSVELARSAYDILKTKKPYSQYKMNPVFMDDPCNNPWMEIEMAPPLEMQRGGKLTRLQKLRAQLKGQNQGSSANEMMPEVPSFGFEAPTPGR